LAVAAVLLASASAALAQGESIDPPDGIQAGPWIIAPSIFANYEWDDNLQRVDDSEQNGDVLGPLTERVWAVGATLGVTLPFRRSRFDFEYETADETFVKTSFDPEPAQRSSIGVDLRFSTGDRLVLADRFTRDYVRVREDSEEDPSVDGEEIFFGEPFNQNRVQFDLSRSVPGHQGYRVRVERRDFDYQGTAPTSLYDYRGFDSVYEFRQPTSEEGWLLFHLSQRRFNHYRPLDPRVGVPYRKEIGNSYQFGWRSNLGKNNPFLLRIGYDTFRYDEYETLTESSVFRGIGGFYSGTFRTGPDSQLNVNLTRQSLPSTQNTYYINNVVRAEFDTDFLRTLNFRGRARLAFNDYGDPIPFWDCDGRREDWVSEIGAEVGWPVHPRMEFSLNGFHERRRSNCEGGSYKDTEISVGLRLGWF
jgi:hypothetical protein